MDISIIFTYQFWIVAIACGVIAFAFKSIPYLPSWLIPLVNLVIGGVLMCALLGFSALNLITGILAASAECYAYELFNSSFKGFSNINPKDEGK
jgi:hypothetical protein